MNRTFVKIGLIICLVAAVAVGWFEFKDKKTETAMIRIATNPWPGYEFIHLADKKGFFREEGVAVKLVRFSALEDARRAYERGQVDGMASTLIELLQAHEHGRGAKIIFMTDFSNGSDVVLARKGISNLLDLKGKKIAVETETLGIFVIARALEKVGLSLDDVKMVGMDALNMQAALLAGEIDALHTYPPYSTKLMKHTDEVIKLFDSTQIPNEIVDIVSLDPDIVAHRSEDVKAIRRAWDKAVTYGRMHPEEANGIMAEIEGISPQDFTEALAGVQILDLSEQKPLMAPGGILEHVLIQVNEVLHRGKPTQKPIRPDDFIAHVEGDQL